MKRFWIGSLAVTAAVGVLASFPSTGRTAAPALTTPTVAAPTAGSSAAAAMSAERPIPDRVRYNRDVRPILSDNCLFCHGFDKNTRKGDLRLDTKDGLLGKREGGPPVVPGKPAESQLVARITTKDADDVMPPANHPKRLTPRDVAVLTKWVEQGGEYEGHWAYLPPVRPAVPPVEDGADKTFVRNPIDQFVLARLKAEGLTHSPEADRTTLIRRVTFDLTGLPPTADEVKAFVADASPDAYEKVVDRLLASPRYGERMAMYWLDLVRYADTIGYHSDVPMNVSPFREWTINAFNANEPFDRFTTEQLAGDLLPNATLEQKVASGYNRLLQTTEEGGAQAREYVVKNFTDRVRNYSTVWLGATLGCAQCHDHKFDPLGTKDFYTMAAFFADVQEADIGRRETGMPVPSAAQQAQIKAFDDRIAAAKATLAKPTSALAAAQAEWEAGQAEGLAVEWKAVELSDLKGKNGTTLAEGPEHVVRVSPPAGGGFPATDAYTVSLALPAPGVTAIKLEAMSDPAFPGGGPGVSPNGNFVLTDFKAEIGDAKADRKSRTPVKFVRAFADFSQPEFPIAHAVDGKAATGWAVLPEFGKPHEAVFEFEKPLTAAATDRVLLTIGFNSQFGQHQIAKFRLSATTSAAPSGASSIPKDLRKTLKMAADKRTPEQRDAVAAYYRSIAPALQPVRDDLAAAERDKADLFKAVPSCLVSTSGPPRTVKILHRGDWQDDAGVVVEPQVPEALGPMPTNGKRLTRLDLANWTVSPKNPLTGRVFVNRAWKLFFGQGLSKVLDDLGFQGEWPTHPELLDYLAVDFAEGPAGSPAGHGWDVKRFVRSLVTTGTYRQASVPNAIAREKDPYNRLYSRQSPFRLDAEMVRDGALSAAGLLVEKVGGRSVFPYQPAGYWFALNFPPREWQNDTGDGLYRRGLYTHWQRSFPHPSLIAFDAPSREEAVCERARSNIPQQALALLNDPTYVEAARALAGKMALRPGDDAEKIRWGFAAATSRPPTQQEAGVIADLLAKHRSEYAADPAAAAKLLMVGAAKNPTAVEPPELAAWTSVARVMLNLSEAITRY